MIGLCSVPAERTTRFAFHDNLPSNLIPTIQVPVLVSGYPFALHANRLLLPSLPLLKQNPLNLEPLNELRARFRRVLQRTSRGPLLMLTRTPMRTIPTIMPSPRRYSAARPPLLYPQPPRPLQEHPIPVILLNLLARNPPSSYTPYPNYSGIPRTRRKLSPESAHSLRTSPGVCSEAPQFTVPPPAPGRHREAEDGGIVREDGTRRSRTC